MRLCSLNFCLPHVDEPGGKNEERYEDESFGVGALTVGMQVKKGCSFLSILFFASTTMSTPQKKTALRIPKNVTLKNVDDVTGQVQCRHYVQIIYTLYVFIYIVTTRLVVKVGCSLS